nr:lysophospholipid acyltransferase family protein [Umezawaea beigongshangensis]
MDLARWIARYSHRVSFRVRATGLEHVPRTGGLLVVSNHSAAVDGQVLAVELPRRIVFLVKRELFVGPIGWCLRKLGQLPVRRGEPDRAPLFEALRVLAAGGTVGIFPEGTRGAGDVISVQDGAAWLARRSGATVLPVATRGTRRPPGAGRRFRPVVDVLVGETFELPAGKGKQSLGVASLMVRDRLAALVAELDRSRSGVMTNDRVSGEGR